MDKAVRSPIFQRGLPGIPVRRPELDDLELRSIAVDMDERVAEEPAMLVLLFFAQMPASATDGEISDAVELKVKHLMQVSRDDVLYTILFGDAVQRKIRIGKHHLQNPRGPMGKDEFRGSVFMQFEILFQEIEFAIG